METHSGEVQDRPSGWGADLKFEKRPGVPKLRLPPARVKGAHSPLAQQPTPVQALTKRVELKRLTPVFGTAQPPTGLSGVIRRFAYQIPEHKARHWLLLLAADQVDVLEHGLARGGITLLAGGIATGVALLARGLMMRARR